MNQTEARTLLSVIERAREIFANLEWTKGEYLKQSSGKPLSSVEDATHCCAIGPFVAIAGLHPDEFDDYGVDDKYTDIAYTNSMRAKGVLEQVCLETTGVGIISYNDLRAKSKRDILDLYDNAIDYLKAQVNRV